MVNFPSALLSDKVSLTEENSVWIEEGGCGAPLHRGEDKQIVVTYTYSHRDVVLPTQVVVCTGCHTLHWRWPSGPPPSAKELGLIKEVLPLGGQDTAAVRHRIIQHAKETKQKKKKCVVGMCTKVGVAKINGLWVCEEETHQEALRSL